MGTTLTRYEQKMEDQKVELSLLKENRLAREVPLRIANLAAGWTFAFVALGLVYHLLLNWIVLV